MPQEVKLWRVHSGDKLEPYKSTPLDLEARLERWIEADISVLRPDLLVIGRQVPTDHGGYIDLLCLDARGNAVVVELKKDKTPRDVVAQALDYASWVRELSNERITTIANEYLGDRGTLDEAFAERFDTELPDLLNESHRIFVVGSRIDSSTERIIEYLSEEHGVDINAASFQFLGDPAGGSTLARVFLIEPERADQQVRARSTSKRRPRLTEEELQRQADEIGVGALYASFVPRIREVFPLSDTSRSSIRFWGEIDGSRRVIFSLLPGDSTAERGVHYQLYWKKLCDMFDLAEVEPAALLPPGAEKWTYGRSKDKTGFSGYLASEADVSRFLDGLAKRPRRA